MARKCCYKLQPRYEVLRKQTPSSAPNWPPSRTVSHPDCLLRMPYTSIHSRNAHIYLGKQTHETAFTGLIFQALLQRAVPPATVSYSLGSTSVRCPIFRITVGQIAHGDNALHLEMMRSSIAFHLHMRFDLDIGDYIYFNQ